MNSEERTNAVRDLTLTYFQSYYHEWRLAKVLTIKKLLDQKYDFYGSLIKDVKYFYDDSGDATIAQEITHALHFDAISQCVQYIEDLFAFINAAKQPDFFIKNIITYDAGRITNLIRSFNTRLTPQKIAEAFHFLDNIPFTNEDDRKMYEDGAAYLMNMVKDVVAFYIDYEYFHTQYKHGMAVAMRPFGNVYSPEQIEEDKAGKFRPYLAAYDNRNLKIAAKKGTFHRNHGALMVGFSENVRPFIGALAQENNFIRLVQPKDIELNIDQLVDIAYKTRACLGIFMSNYSEKIRIDKSEKEFHLPLDYRTTEAVIISYW